MGKVTHGNITCLVQCDSCGHTMVMPAVMPGFEDVPMACVKCKAEILVTLPVATVTGWLYYYPTMSEMMQNNGRGGGYGLNSDGVRVKRKGNGRRDGRLWKPDW